MIDNKFILNINSKELTQNKPKVTEEKGFKNNDFKKILNDKTEKTNTPTNDENVVNKSLDKKEPISSKEIKDINTEDSNFEESVKEVVEIISNDENFQGNKLDSEVTEEIVALLNQILNSPELKSLLPVKLEDPMIMPSTNIEVNNDITLIGSVNNEKDIQVANNFNTDNFIKDITSLNTINPAINMETGKNSDNNKEALNLANNILEALNSKNINGVLSSDEIQEFKSALEVLSEKLFEQNTDLSSKTNILSEIAKEPILGIKELKTTKTTSKAAVVTVNETEDSIESNVKSILSDLKSSLSSERVTEIKSVEVNSGTPNYGLTSEANEEDKVLAKILGESESGSLNKQNTLLNRLNVKSSEFIKEPMVVNKETMNSDIIKNVKFMMRNAVSELKVKIYPKELGEMTIKLLSEEGILKADIKAVSKETYNLLNSNMSEIKKSLEQQNIKIHEVNIGLYSDDTTYYSGENSRDDMFERNKSKDGKNFSGESGFISDDLEDEGKLYNDSSVNLLV